MSTDRSAAVALVVGALATLVTMALHPTGHDVVRNASAGAANALATAVHALALVAEPLLLAGTLAFTLGRVRRDLAVGAYACFALAAVAALIAAAASGFVAPAVVRGLAGADEPTRAAMLGALHVTGVVNQAFARIHVLLAGVAFVVWSVTILAGREPDRALAAYGLLLGGALLLGVASGRLHLDVYGFGHVVLGEGVWLVWVAVTLWRAADGRSP